MRALAVRVAGVPGSMVTALNSVPSCQGTDLSKSNLCRGPDYPACSWSCVAQRDVAGRRAKAMLKKRACRFTPRAGTNRAAQRKQPMSLDQLPEFLVRCSIHGQQGSLQRGKPCKMLLRKHMSGTGRALQSPHKAAGHRSFSRNLRCWLM